MVLFFSSCPLVAQLRTSSFNKPCSRAAWNASVASLGAHQKTLLKDLGCSSSVPTVPAQGISEFLYSCRDSIVEFITWCRGIDLREDACHFFDNLGEWYSETTASCGRTARNIGISARARIRQTIDAIFSLLDSYRSTLSETLSSAILRIKTLLSRCLDTFLSFVQRTKQFLSDHLEFIVCALICCVVLQLSVALQGFGSGFASSLCAIVCSVVMIYASRIFWIDKLQSACLTAMQIFLSRSFFSFRPHAQGAPTVEAQSEISNDFARVLKGGLHCTAFLFCASADLELGLSGPALEKAMKRSILVGRSFQVWEKFIDDFSSFLDDAVVTVAKHVFGKEILSSRRNHQVDEICAEIMDLFSFENQLKVGKDREMATRIEFLYRKLMVIRTNFSDNRTVLATLDPFSSAISNLYGKVCLKNPLAHVMRQEPVCVVFSGEPGRGKSYLMGPLQQDLAKITGRYQEDAPIDSQVYVRCQEQEYWDGYCGQPIVIFDDFGQAVDSINNPNLDFHELIRAVNIFPYPLHSAALHEKANNPFNAEFVILTTNLRVPRAVSIISQEALLRRLHLHINVDAHPAVLTNGTIDVVKLTKYRLDNNLPESDKSHWFFSVGNKSLTYQELICLISKQYQQHYESFLQRQRIAKATASEELPEGCFRRPRDFDPPPPPPRSRASSTSSQSSHTSHSSSSSSESIHVSSQSLSFSPPRSLSSFGESIDGFFYPYYSFTPRAQALNNRIPDILFQDYIRLPIPLRRQIVQVGWRVAFSEDMVCPTADFPYDGSYEEILAFASDQYQDHVDNIIQLRTDLYLDRRALFLNLDYDDTAFQNWENYMFFNAQPDGMPEFSRGQSRWEKAQRKLFNVWRNFRFDRHTLVLILSGIYSFVVMLGIALAVRDIYLHWNIKLRHPDYWKAMYFAKRNEANVLTEIEEQWEHSKMHLQLSLDLCPHCSRLSASQLHNEKVTQEDYENFLSTFPEKLIRLASLEATKARFGVEGTFSSESPTRQPANQPTIRTEHTFESATRTPPMRVIQTEDPANFSRKRDPLAEVLLSAESGRSSDTERKRSKVSCEGPVSQQADELCGMLRKSTGALWVQVGDEKIFVGYLTFIKGNKCLMNKHFISAVAAFCVRAQNNSEAFSVWFGNVPGDPLVELDFQQIIESRVEVKRSTFSTEFVMLTMPTSVQPRPNILKHFIPRHKLADMRAGLRMLMPTYERTSRGYSQVTRDGFFEKTADVQLSWSKSDGSPQITHYPQSGYVQMSTKKGDCGTPLVIGSDSFAKKICGIHFGGDAGMGVFCVLTYEDLEPLVRSEIYEDSETLTVSAHVSDFPLTGSTRYIGTVAQPVFQGTKTKKVRSLIFNQVVETSVAPSAMAHPLAPDGPMLKGLTKSIGPVTLSDPTSVRLAIHSYKEMLYEHKDAQSDRFVLTFEQACKGIDGDEAYPPLKRTKSAGFPYCLRATKGKEDWLGTGDWTFDQPRLQELRDDVGKLIEKAKRGVISEVIFVDTLKDELRPLDKVLAGKTRTFCAAPLHFSVAFRMYFSGFLAFMYKRRITNECAVGIDARSAEWGRLASTLRLKGDNMIAGDFSNFDGTIEHSLFMGVLEVINDWYADSAENKLVRKVLWSNIHHSKHLLNTYVYQLAHGQPSGNPATAITNSMYNSLAIRYCYFRATGRPDFNRKCAVITYGDDHIISVSQDVCEHFNPKVLTQHFSELGMVYTSEDKGEQTEAFRPLSQVSFLKRGFALCPETGYMMAPLALTSILEMTNWVSTTHGAQDAIRMNCIDACEELLFHSQATYTEYTDKITHALSARQLNIPTIDWKFGRQLIASGRLYLIREAERPRV